MDNLLLDRDVYLSAEKDFLIEKQYLESFLEDYNLIFLGSNILDKSKEEYYRYYYNFHNINKKYDLSSSPVTDPIEYILNSKKELLKNCISDFCYVSNDFNLIKKSGKKGLNTILFDSSKDNFKDLLTILKKN